MRGYQSKVYFLVVLLAIITVPILLQAQTKRIYIANDDHTDYMWSADENVYRTAFLQMLDYYLSLADQTDAEPAQYQSRFNCDGSFWMWTYEKNKPSSNFQRLINRIRSGHISVPLNALNSTYGGQPLEAVLRGMYYPGQIERKYGLRFSRAGAMENQTMPYGLGSLWAGAGAKYVWHGICGCVSQIPDAWDREHDIYHWVGPDGSSLLVKWNSMLCSNQSIGGYAEARDPYGIVDYLDVNPDFITRYPYSVIGAFGKGWDGLKTLTDEFVAAAKYGTNANRRVIVSNMEDFFEDFELNYGAGLPEVSVSFGNEWDLLPASMSELTASVKRSVETLRSAEALATLVSLKEPAFMNSRVKARDQAWMNLGLYWEHDWTADGPVSKEARRDWQRRIARGIQSYVDDLFADASARLGRMIPKTGTNLRFYVFNQLSWARTDYADLAYTGTGPVHVIDLTTGQEVPSQIVTVGGKASLRVQAKDVPPVGYKVFEIVSGTGTSFSDAATVSGDVIESSSYSITVSNYGAISSLVDKQRGNREFAKNINGQTINDLGGGSGSLWVENSGPVSVTIRADSSSILSHTSRITLFRDSDRIDIRNDINQNFSDTFTWGFGFNLNSPDVWHEEVGAVIQAKLSGQGGHYSHRNARYDWLTLNHFVDMSDGTVGITLSNADTSFMKLGLSDKAALDVSTPQISPLVGGQIDGLSIPNQGGDTHFLQRFALRTHDAFNTVDAMRFALEHQNPLVARTVTGGSEYPEASFSLITISNPNLLLWALKPSEDGIASGIIARIWNQSSNRESLSLKATGGISSAWQVTHIETPKEPASVTAGELLDEISGRQIKTYLLTPPSTGSTKKATLRTAKSQRNNGKGTITSEDGFITCGVGKACSAKYDSGAQVTLMADALPGSTFAGWHPLILNCPGMSPCKVTMDKTKTVRAMFIGDYVLKVTATGQKVGKVSGAGTVSYGSVINCTTVSTSNCNARVPYHTLVTLTAFPGDGSTFKKWSGCPSSSGSTCNLTMDKAFTVRATFMPN